MAEEAAVVLHGLEDLFDLCKRGTWCAKQERFKVVLITQYGLVGSNLLDEGDPFLPYQLLDDALELAQAVHDATVQDQMAALVVWGFMELWLVEKWQRLAVDVL